MTGVAPKAKLIPLRTSHGVFYPSGEANERLAKAIKHAVDKGCKVISMSLGGFGSSKLRKAVEYANKNDVIMIAAVGNRLLGVLESEHLWPARYPEVVGVCACNMKGNVWKGAFTGKEVDITAPGEDVWRAKTVKVDDAKRNYFVEPGSGTSYATAIVAGIAALWLAHHGGWNKLKAKYKQDGLLSAVFRYLLKTKGYSWPTGKTWNTKKHGVGIVDARKLLAAPLPSANDPKLQSAIVLEAPAEVGHQYQNVQDELIKFCEYLGQDSGKVQKRLVDLFKTDVKGLEVILKDVGDELFLYVLVNGKLLKALRRGPIDDVRNLLVGAAVSGRLKKLLE